MLKISLTHPEILAILGKAGHGAKVLIADGDYPVLTTGGKNTSIVHLNLSAGVVNCIQVLEAMLPILLVEAAAVMDVPSGQPDEPPVWREFGNILQKNGYNLPLRKIERFKFYDEVAEDSTALIIQTGDLSEYANLLLTIGSL
jgi:L-fucose mutarotase